MFEFEFMRRAFFVGIMLAAVIPCIGVVVVLRRLSMIGDALSHTSLAGVAGGLIIGINPILGALVTCIGAALAIEAVRKKFPRHGELAIAVMMSAGVGLAGVLSGFVPNGANFNNFLFGSIVAISEDETRLVICVGAVVAVLFVLLFQEMLYITFDEASARLSGVRVELMNFLFTLLTAVTVSIASRTIGALMVSSLMVLPVACSMQTARSYRQTVCFSILFGILFTASGLCISYYVGLKPGGTIVLTGVITLILLLVGKWFLKKLRVS